MADELKMKQGEGLWQDKYNRLVDAVEKMGGVVDQLHWTKPTDEGVVLLNGFTGWVSYSYLPIGDSKLVFLEGALKGNLKARQYTDILTIPDNIRPDNKMYQYRRWNTIAELVNNKLGAFNDVDQDDMNTSSWNVIFNFTYKI